jgi:hypothetical protein
LQKIGCYEREKLRAREKALANAVTKKPRVLIMTEHAVYQRERVERMRRLAVENEIAQTSNKTA